MPRQIKARAHGSALAALPFNRRLGHGLIGALLLIAARGAAAPPPAAVQAVPLAEFPLAQLPKPPARVPGTPTAGHLTIVDNLISRLISGEEPAPVTALSTLAQGNEAWLPAAAERLRRVAERADKEAMKALLASLVNDEKKASSSEAEPDYLAWLLGNPNRASSAWRDLVTVSALSHFFAATHSVEGARQLIQIYVRFGEFLRVDTQRRLSKLELHSAAALIEATRHPAQKISEWAVRQLRTRGLNKPSALVQQAEGSVLADILRAYGYTRNPDVAALLISFASSSQTMIRLAAREAVAAMGEVAHWPLRDAFERIAGRRPPREWSWERTARELFREMDRTRLDRVLAAFNAGVAAHAQKDWTAMRQNYDEVLATDPDFEQGSVLAQGYYDCALAQVSTAPIEATEALRRARRVVGIGDLKPRIESLLATLEGEQLLRTGIADQILFRRAVELDPQNTRAQQTLEQIASPSAEAPSPLRRYAAAGTVGLLTVLAMLLLLRKSSGAKALAPAPEHVPPN